VEDVEQKGAYGEDISLNRLCYHKTSSAFTVRR
jgi:hypothetical protein